MLYKYYSPQLHNFDAVINGKFYFSKVCKLNDPFDSNFKLVEPYKEFLRKVPIAPNADKIIGNYGTCSFSEEANNKHLWALYTDSYKGFVIEYNKEKLEEISNIISAPCPLHPVDYRKELLCLNDVNAQFELEVNGEKQSFKVGECLSDDKKRDRLFEYLCYVKEEKIWGNEKEWRLFAGRHISEKQNSKIEYKENGYLIPIPEGAIKSVIVGHNMEDLNLPYICRIARQYNIKIKKTNPNTENKKWDIDLIDFPLECKK